MTKLKEPTRFIKRRYDICVFDKSSGKTILWKKSNFRRWYADPFLADEDGKTYCFVELMDNHVKYGLIGVIDEKGKVTPVVDAGYHLSFPNVFEHDGRWFMMPESSANKDLHLYVADTFPYKWSFYKTLLNDVKVCDSVFFGIEGGEFLLVYDFDGSVHEVVIYEFDWQKLEVGKKLCVIPDPKKLLRPAGKVIYQNGKVIIPTQKGTDSYGEDVLFNEIVKTKDGFSIVPTEFETHYPEDVVSKYDHKHTYNTCGDKAVLDFSKLVFSPLQLLDGAPCTLRRLFRKKGK